jgi:hypothetical protein
VVGLCDVPLEPPPMLAALSLTHSLLRRALLLHRRYASALAADNALHAAYAASPTAARLRALDHATLRTAQAAVAHLEALRPALAHYHQVVADLRHCAAHLPEPALTQLMRELADDVTPAA